MIAAQIIALAINLAWGDWGQEGGCVGHQPSPPPLRRSCQGAGVAHCFRWSCQLHIALLQRRREPCLSGGITIKAAYRVILACGQAADGAANCMAEPNKDFGNSCADLRGRGADRTNINTHRPGRGLVKLLGLRIASGGLVRA